MKKVFVQLVLALAVVSLFASCQESESVAPISGQVICRGGCNPNTYYVDITSDRLKGKTQTIIDYNGVNRGQFTNVLVINNLKTSDQQEGKTIFFKKYQDHPVGCQSSYPPMFREIDITY